MLGKTKLTSMALSLALTASALAADTPGVTATEIKIGGVFPFSGPASSIGLVGKGVLAYVQSINDRGGIKAGRSTTSRWTMPTARQSRWSNPQARGWRRGASFSASSVRGKHRDGKIPGRKGVPTIAIVSGSSKFTNVQDYPRTTTGLVSYDVEGQIYAKDLSRTVPTGKYAILYQNDDLGKDYVNAFTRS